MDSLRKSWHGILALIGALLLAATPALAQQKPNILFINGDAAGISVPAGQQPERGEHQL